MMLNIILISIPILFFVGFLLHFAYEYSNNNKIIGLLVPVNESIFEHSKLLLLPLTVLWFIIIIFFNNGYSFNSLFFSMLISIIASIITMISFYYTYIGIMGKDIDFINILDLLISLIVGQLIAYHVYMYSNGIPWYISLIIILSIFIIYIYLTIKPIKIPLFIDKKSKTYGINKER